MGKELNSVIEIKMDSEESRRLIINKQNVLCNHITDNRKLTKDGRMITFEECTKCGKRW